MNAADSPLDGKIRHSHGQRKLGRPDIVTPEEIEAVREATAALVDGLGKHHLILRGKEINTPLNACTQLIYFCSCFLVLKAEAQRQLAIKYPELDFSRHWCESHFPKLLEVKQIMNIEMENKPMDQIVAEFKEELRAIFMWRLRALHARYGGNLSLEWRLWRTMRNADEKPVKFLPEHINRGWSSSLYNILFASSPDGNEVIPLR